MATPAKRAAAAKNIILIDLVGKNEFLGEIKGA
jgi:hypothetical protein